MDDFFRIANQKRKPKFIQEQLQLEMPPLIPLEKKEAREAQPERGGVVIDMYGEEDC